MSLPLFPVTTVGSWPRPPRVAEAMRAYRRRRIDRAEFDRIADAAVVDLLRQQETLGCDIVTDGELRRDNFYSFVADKLSGVRLMTLAEMLEVVEDKAGFEQLLQTLDVPAYSISSPVCIGAHHPAGAADGRRPGVRAPPHGPADQGHAARTLSPDPGDVRSGADARVLPGQGGRWRTTSSRSSAPSSRSCRSAGAEFVQFDEPVLTEVAFAPGRTRTFMCAALAARRDPAEELEFAVSLINRVVAGVDDLRIGLHVCRGNWSRDETTLLSGGYQALRTYLDRLQITQLVLEYATERAGTLVEFEGKELGLGVVNPRTDQVETPEQIRAAVEEALVLYPAERVFLNPDCGFGTFSNRPMNTLDIASAKVAAMAAAARDLRGRS